MRTVYLLGITALVAGCQTPQDLQRTVGNASNFQLCRAVMLAPRNVAEIAATEAQRRSLDCAPYAQSVMQNEAQNRASQDALARQLLTPAPMPRTPITCNSYRVGNSVGTDCF